VFDDEDRVAAVAEIFERADEAVVVARVQTDARFVEHVECARKRRAQLRREADTLRFAAGERVGAAVEREVTEAH
jgi:GTP cyclohydrolase FolE2